jgi:hypothetical protein
MLEERYRNVGERVGNVEEKVGNVEEKVGNVGEKVGNVGQRIGNVDETVRAVAAPLPADALWRGRLPGDADDARIARAKRGAGRGSRQTRLARHQPHPLS